ncbi:Geranylgeranyl pyrophosphate synthase [Penicillium angulare]|uniref:Geranylgeranyl pyrophosphate synthase n=1 Tax=Penicillium angulare TaxID=116970 RepID=A0A9W9FJ26_9EURO|nr:Geranylgeranyl pyrophosphate synthase [Penicillium angulare]
MLHTASLLIDDIGDESELRRGITTAHRIFRAAQIINSANYVYFLALQETQKLKNPAASESFTKELLNLRHGQGMELYWRERLSCPTESQYLKMVSDKTGGLFRLALRLMQAESSIDSPNDFMSLVNIKGLIFQICDDYLNLCDSTYTKNKGLYEDLTEGKFSFPVIHAINSGPDYNPLISILKKRTEDEDLKLCAIEYMRRAGSFEYTRIFVRKLHVRALSLVETMESSQSHNGEPGSERRRKVIHKIVTKTIGDD